MVIVLVGIHLSEKNIGCADVGHLYSLRAASGMAHLTKPGMTIFAAGVAYKVRRLVGGLGWFSHFPMLSLIILLHFSHHFIPLDTLTNSTVPVVAIPSCLFPDA